jgi:hypothetical protein
MDPITMTMLSQIGGKAVGGATATIGGIVQLATGLGQLRKARQLPFPSFREGLQYASENARLYQENFQKGLGQERMDQFRANIGAQTIKNYRNIVENAPQMGSYYGRVMGLEKANAERELALMNQSFKEAQVPGIVRAKAEISGIMQQDIAAQRQYKMAAEQAAGAAIKTGSENLMAGAQILSGGTYGG